MSWKFFLFDLVTCSYPPSPWAMGISRLWGPLEPFPFSLWVPQPLYMGFPPRGDVRSHLKSHLSCYGILPQRVTIRIKSKSCFVNLLPIEAESEFCKLVFVNRIISAYSRCTQVTSVFLMLVKPRSWFSSCSGVVMQSRKSLVWVLAGLVLGALVFLFLIQGSIIPAL